MKKLRANATSLISLLFGVALVFSPSANTQELSTLIQSAHFTPTDKPQSAISQRQSESFLNAFLFFDRGSRILSNYREPQATRGAKGISIYRDVSPAVTLVVTGDNKNNVDGIGTGVIVDSSGYVLTNWHVVAGHEDAVIFMKPPSGADVEKKYAYYARVPFCS